METTPKTMMAPKIKAMETAMAVVDSECFLSESGSLTGRGRAEIEVAKPNLGLERWERSHEVANCWKKGTPKSHGSTPSGILLSNMGAMGAIANPQSRLPSGFSTTRKSASGGMP